MPITDVEITELESFEPTRVDGVGKGANGFPILMLKSVGDAIEEIEADLGDILEEVDKAKGQAQNAVDDDRPVCTTCKGDGKIMGDKRTCPKCKGSGKMPKVGDSAKAVDGSAPSGAEVPLPAQCPTCNGSGTLLEPGGSGDPKECPDCGGSGEDGKLPSGDQLHAVDADAGSIHEGDAAGREAIDKATDEDDVEKDGATFSASNPALQPEPNDVDGADGDPTDPGSPAWEAMDAQALIAAGQQLAQVAAMLQASRSREAQEVAAGHTDDVEDVMDLNQALACLDQCLGLVATLAFREEAEAHKAIEDDGEGVAEKAGKRLSRKTITHLAATRDHLTELLGLDDPSKPDATKSQEIEDMTAEELIQLLDARDAQKAATEEEIDKGKPAENNAESIANAKAANAKAKGKNPKDDNDDLEDEAGDETGDSASGTNQATGAAKAAEEEEEVTTEEPAAKAELTPEQIEAKKARKALKKQLREAEELEKQVAADARVQELIAERIVKAQEAYDELKNELEEVKKMAQPGGPVKVAPREAVEKAAQRDAVELEISKYEMLAKNTNERDLSREYANMAKELRLSLVANTTTN